MENKFLPLQVFDISCNHVSAYEIREKYTEIALSNLNIDGFSHSTTANSGTFTFTCTPGVNPCPDFEVRFRCIVGLNGKKLKSPLFFLSFLYSVKKLRVGLTQCHPLIQTNRMSRNKSHDLD